MEASSEQREEIVRKAFAAFAARDLDALRELVSPDVELRPLVSVWQRNYRGIEGLEQWFEEVNKTWDAFEFHADEVRDIDAERVLVTANWRGRAVAGGSEVGGPSAFVVTFGADDKVVLADFFLNEEQALSSLD